MRGGSEPSPPSAQMGTWEESTNPGTEHPTGPADKAPAGGMGGGGGGQRKGVWRGTPILHNEFLSAVNRVRSSTRSQWLCF